jgi:3-phenylpropionate/trans-cinnamate dioxygenase ferredoxin reductase component
MTDPIVIVGAGMAGGAAATTLRTEGFDDPIVLIGAEDHPPYERPPLSKELLRGEVPDVAKLHDRRWYSDNAVELILGRRVERFDPGLRRVDLDDGRMVAFDQLLLATGGRNRELDVPGRDLDGVHGLRTLEDCLRIRDEASRASKAVIVGAGFIGSEVAASLRQLGLEVEVVEPFATPLLRVLGPEVGAVVEAVHRDHGVRFHLGEGVARFDGADRVERVVTDKGTEIDCDLAVVGVGIRPNVELAAAAGLAVGDGVLVDGRCRTSAEHVFAAGDVAGHEHPVFGRRLRVEHFDNALKQGTAAARNMLGVDAPFDDPHWFWSDQYDVNIQYAGFAPEWEELIVRGSLADRTFVAFYLQEGVVRAAVGMDSGRDVRRSMALVKGAVRPDPAALRDSDVDLRKLVPRATHEAAAATASAQEASR